LRHLPCRLLHRWSGTNPDSGPTGGKIEDVLLVADAIGLTATKDLRGADKDHRWTYELASWNNSSIFVTGDNYHAEINSKRVWTSTQDYMVKAWRRQPVCACIAGKLANTVTSQELRQDIAVDKAKLAAIRPTCL
jgi:hypothetical protein